MYLYIPDQAGEAVVCDGIRIVEVRVITKQEISDYWERICRVFVRNN